MSYAVEWMLVAAVISLVAILCAPCLGLLIALAIILLAATAVIALAATALATPLLLTSSIRRRRRRYLEDAATRAHSPVSEVGIDRSVSLESAPVS